MKLILAIIYGAIGQAISFVSFQGSYRYKILQQNEWLIYLSGVPAAYAFYKSVHYFADHYEGDMWPGRLLGFAVGVVVFSFLSWLIFSESMNLKTLVCLLLSCVIIAIQAFWK